MTAPYQQIAAGIRARISTGELGPGERVPSTRELMRGDGVAMATATKALTTLQQEGPVHARPGGGACGGAVAPATRGRPTRRQEGLVPSRPGVGAVVGPARRAPVRSDEPALSRDE